MREIGITVEAGDVLTSTADALVLKHAQALYGADGAVVAAFKERGTDLLDKLPPSGSTLLVPSAGAVKADQVLFVGVSALRQFDYLGIRKFAHDALSQLAAERVSARHVIFTLHGPGFGLDESESLRAEIGGLIDAIGSGRYPMGLQSIAVIERDPGRARRLASELARILPSGKIELEAAQLSNSTGTPAYASLAGAGAASAAKPHVFVAMPFADDFADRFHYGIQNATNAAGYLCERADLASFTGDVMDWVRDRIDTAAYLIADLTGANANVYLEVGYAWGRNIPTILLVSDSQDLKFDTRGQRCLVYKNSIKRLEQLLNDELAILSKGPPHVR